MNVFNSGKHNGKTYAEVLSTDTNYVAAVYSGSFYPPKGNGDFVQYIEEHLDKWDKEEDDYEPSGNMSTYVRANWKRARFREWFKNVVYDNHYGSDKRYVRKFPAIKRPSVMPPDVFGTFIDYYIRYTIAMKKNIDDFVDDRSHSDCAGFDDELGFQRWEAYEAYCNKEASRLDIFLISLRHHIAFRRDVSAVQRLIVDSCTTDDDGCFTDNGVLDEIDLTAVDQWIDGKIENAKQILLNPSLGNKFFHENGLMSASIAADGDLIIDDEIIDFKCYQLQPTIIDWLQLAGYAWLYPLRYSKTEHYKEIAKLTIYNPIRGKEYTVDGMMQEMIDELLDINDSDDEEIVIEETPRKPFQLSPQRLQYLFLGFGDFFPLITTPEQPLSDNAFKCLAERIDKFKRSKPYKYDNSFMNHLYCPHCKKYCYYPSGEHDKCPSKPINKRPPEVIAREKEIAHYKHCWEYNHNEEQRNDFRKAAKSGKSSSQSEYIQKMVKLIQEGHIE